MIETALPCETVAEESSVSGPPRAWTAARQGQTHSRRDVLGCSRKEKNGSTTSKNKTVTTRHPARPRYQNLEPRPTKRHAAVSALGVRKKTHQKPLDTKGPFRDVPPDPQPKS